MHGPFYPAAHDEPPVFVDAEPLWALGYSRNHISRRQDDNVGRLWRLPVLDSVFPQWATV